MVSNPQRKDHSQLPSVYPRIKNLIFVNRVINVKRTAYAKGRPFSHLEVALPFNLGVPKTKEVAEDIIGK